MLANVKYVLPEAAAIKYMKGECWVLHRCLNKINV